MSTDKHLDGKVALITGASRGIGAAIAKGLASNGIHVILIARTIGALEELDDAITLSGGSSTLVPLDLLDFPAIERLGATIFERWGKLDILISNAAMLGKLTPLHHYDPSTWDNVINLNLVANQRLIRSFDPLLRQSTHGRAIFLSATVARVATPYWGAYAASKSGLEMMIKVYAKETEKTNLKVNIVDPGITKTSLRASAFPGEDASKLKSPERLVPLFLNLCSAENQAHGQLIKYDKYDQH